MKLTMTSPKTAGRVAGVLYLILIGLGATAELIRTNLIVPGDATATVNTIRASGDALRISLFADFGAHLSYLLVAVILYSLVRRANNGLSVLFVLMVSISVAMMCLNLVNQVAAIIIVDSPDYLQVFSRTTRRPRAVLSRAAGLRLRRIGNLLRNLATAARHRVLHIAHCPARDRRVAHDRADRIPDRSRRAACCS
jgi:hypothetical protein